MPDSARDAGAPGAHPDSLRGAPAAANGRKLIVIDNRISLGAILHLLVLVGGGLWAFAHLDASVTALRDGLVDFKQEVRAHLGSLDAQMATKEDKPVIYRP
jgi:hypothetical protein